MEEFSELLELQNLSLISQVTQKIDQNIGINDKSLGEFIVHLAKSSGQLEEFKQKLDANGADFPQEFIRQLFILIQSHNPKPNRDRSRSRERLQIGKVYEGKVSKVTSYGVIVKGDAWEGTIKGSIDLDRNQKVQVKLIADNEFELIRAENLASNPYYESQPEYGLLTGVKLEVSNRQTKARISSPELWEAKILIAANVYDPKVHPDINAIDQEDEQDVEIELVEDEPHFLKGMTSKAGATLAPVKIVRNPDGSLARSAQNQGVMAKERREQREYQQKEAIQNIPRDIMKA